MKWLYIAITILVFAGQVGTIAFAYKVYSELKVVQQQCRLLEMKLRALENDDEGPTKEIDCETGGQHGGYEQQ